MTNTPQGDPETAAAIVKFAIVESALLVAGLVAFFVWDTVWGIVAAAVLGAILMNVLVILPAIQRANRNKP